MAEAEDKDYTVGHKVSFETTHWSVVLAASDTNAPNVQEALTNLCNAYWYPIYAYVRRCGYNSHDAQDLTQEFFARLLRSHYFALADRKRGKFRSFLISSLKHFLSHEWDKAKAQKRGGGAKIISIDEEEGENRYKFEPRDNVAADVLFDRRWALTLLEQVLSRLKTEYEKSGKAELFNTIESALTGSEKLPSYTEIGKKLDMTEGAVKVAVHRLRQRYGELLREEIANTVSSPEEVEEELRNLFEALKTG